MTTLPLEVDTKLWINDFKEIKVNIFWEGHKFLLNFHRRFVLCTSEISQNFVAFSEYMNQWNPQVKEYIFSMQSSNLTFLLII